MNPLDVIKTETNAEILVNIMREDVVIMFLNFLHVMAVF